MHTSRRIGILGLSTLIIISCSLLTPITQTTPESPASSNTAVSAPTEDVPASWGKQTKTSDCQVNGPFQDRACTPGAIFPNVTKSDICVSGYSRSVRNVPDSEKNK